MDPTLSSLANLLNLLFCFFVLVISDRDAQLIEIHM